MKLPMRSKLAQSAKFRKMGAMGSLKAANKAEHAPRKYASGGVVDMGPAVEGDAPKPRLDKPGRSKGKKDAGKKGTSVNIVIMSGGKKDGPDGGPPMMPPGAGPMPPPGPPSGPPPGATPMPPGGLPMRARGGRVHEDKAEDEKLFNKMINAHDAKKK